MRKRPIFRRIDSPNKRLCETGSMHHLTHNFTIAVYDAKQKQEIHPNNARIRIDLSKLN